SAHLRPLDSSPQRGSGGPTAQLHTSLDSLLPQSYPLVDPNDELKDDTGYQGIRVSGSSGARREEK
ncbi:hypothetical protein FRC11_011715, partial [Ceratobasidium sp. 423]